MHRWLLCSISVVLAIGCQAIPDAKAHHVGTISFKSSWGYMIKDPAGCDWLEPGCEAAEVGVPSSARVVWRAGGKASIRDLVPGRRISVWTTGETQDRLPVIVTARTVVIEGDR